MAEYRITGTFHGRDARPLRKALANLEVNGWDTGHIDSRCHLRVERVKPNKSRAHRFSEALDDVRAGQEAIVELRDELQEWRDNIPENLEDGEKAEQLDTAIDALTAFEEIEVEVDVEFPTMF